MTSNRVKVNWKVPASEWDAFREYVHEKYDAIDGHTGREVEMAMKEWVDQDDYHGLEERIDRLVQAAGRTPEDCSQKKSSVDGFDLSEDSTTVGSRVHCQLKDEFRAFVNEHTDLRYGVALAHALRARRYGGRSQRLEDKLDRVIDDAEEFLKDVNGEGKMSHYKKQTIKISQRLTQDREGTGALLRDDLHAAIEEIAGGSDPTIREYEERVIDHMDLEEHPNNWKVLCTPGYLESLGQEPDPDAPAIDRKNYSDLTRDEKVRGLKIELAREAQTHGGKWQFDAETIKLDVFGGHPSPSHVHDLISVAGGGRGYDSTTHRGKKVLRVSLERAPLFVERALNSGLDQTTTNAQAATDGGQPE